MQFSTYIGKTKIRFDRTGIKGSKCRLFKLGLTKYINEPMIIFHLGYYDLTIWYRG